MYEYLGARFMEQFTALESCIPFLFPMGRCATADLSFGRLTVHCIRKGFTHGRAESNYKERPRK